MFFCCLNAKIKETNNTWMKYWYINLYKSIYFKNIMPHTMKLQGYNVFYLSESQFVSPVSSQAQLLFNRCKEFVETLKVYIGHLDTMIRYTCYKEIPIPSTLFFWKFGPLELRILWLRKEKMCIFAGSFHLIIFCKLCSLSNHFVYLMGTLRVIICRIVK